ncbi:MAG: type II toxin-antitoxin system VapC family toxin [Acidimicrobiia bacterium]
MSAAYVESSAMTKLVLDEQQSTALRHALRAHDHWVSSDLTVIEVTRAASRARGDEGRAQARAALLPLGTLPVDRTVVSAASRLEPSTLRPLDAIHIATALALAPDDVVFYSYDARTIDAARAAGLTVSSPT